MVLSTASQVLIAIAVFGCLVIGIEVFFVWRARRQRLAAPSRFPAVSLIKPLCGLDDGLAENLASHLDQDYPGEWEVLLGVRSEEDPAYPLARDFAAANPDRVRLVLQEGEPGHNPKVNQLITLTRRSRHEIIALTDSNIRIQRSYLREIVSTLEKPGVGIATQIIAGVGEQRLGAVLDNLTLALFVAPNMTTSTLLLKMDEVVGKSMAMRREDLARCGGWHEVKDVLAEDHRLGMIFRANGLHGAFCPTPILNVQSSQPLRAFYDRHCRWLMIRYRTFFPGVLGEPLIQPLTPALLAALASPTQPVAWASFAGVLLFVAAMTQLSAKLIRGHGFKLRHLALLPLREAVFLAAWARGATLRWVNWRGNRLLVLKGTRLAAPITVARAKKIQRLGRGRED